MISPTHIFLFTIHIKRPTKEKKVPSKPSKTLTRPLLHLLWTGSCKQNAERVDFWTPFVPWRMLSKIIFALLWHPALCFGLHQAKQVCKLRERSHLFLRNSTNWIGKGASVRRGTTSIDGRHSSFLHQAWRLPLAVPQYSPVPFLRSAATDSRTES